MQSIESIPTWLSDYLDITLETAQAILSIAVIFAVLLPVMYLSVKMEASSNMPIILTFFLVESVLVGIGWLSFWILIATVALLAAGVATLGSRAVLGR